MSNLPRWASVALSARCGRILSPKLDLKWPTAPSEVRQLFISVVTGAESAASQGLASEQLASLASELTMFVGVFELRLRGLDRLIDGPIAKYEALRDPLPANEDDLRIVRDTLDVGARAARAATQPDDSGAYREAMDAVSWTLSTLDDLREAGLHDHVVALTERLHDLCETKKATRGTTVWWSEDDWCMAIPRRAWWRFW